MRATLTQPSPVSPSRLARPRPNRSLVRTTMTASVTHKRRPEAPKAGRIADQGVQHRPKGSCRKGSRRVPAVSLSIVKRQPAAGKAPPAPQGGGEQADKRVDDCEQATLSGWRPNRGRSAPHTAMPAAKPERSRLRAQLQLSLQPRRGRHESATPSLRASPRQRKRPKAKIDCEPVARFTDALDIVGELAAMVSHQTLCRSVITTAMRRIVALKISADPRQGLADGARKGCDQRRADHAG